MKNKTDMKYFNTKIDNKDLKKIPSVSSILIILSAFFAPFGEGAQKIFNFDVSKVFVILIVLLVFYWILFVRYKFRAFPKYFNYFIFFIILHTLITWILFYPGELFFKYTGRLSLQEDFYRIYEANGIKILRFFLFASYGLALASLVKNKKQFISLVLAYSIGSIVMMRLGGYTFESEIARYSGGVLDSNSFGLSMLILIFLNIIVLNMEKKKIWIKALSIISIIYGIYGLIISYSRGALVGLLFGLFIFFLYSAGITRKIKFILLVMIIFLLLFFIYPNLLAITEYRMSYTNIMEKHASYRFDIWVNYLKKFNNYFILGTGMERYTEISKYFTIKAYATPHNIYLRVLVEYGIVGFLLFIIALRKILKQIVWFTKKYNKNNVNGLILGVLVAWLINGLFFGNLYERSTWILLGIVLSYKTWGFEKIKNQYDNISVNIH